MSGGVEQGSSKTTDSELHRNFLLPQNAGCHTTKLTGLRLLRDWATDSILWWRSAGTSSVVHLRSTAEFLLDEEAQWYPRENGGSLESTESEVGVERQVGERFPDA